MRHAVSVFNIMWTKNPINMRKRDKNLSKIMTEYRSVMSRILLVDDDKDIIFIIKRKLGENGFDVDIFDDPYEALQNFKPKFYDLIILDVRMPGMNGFDLFEKLKEIDPSAKINFMTAFEFYPNEEKQIVSDLGGSGFIQKPISINKLIEIINRQIKTQNIN